MSRATRVATRIAFFVAGIGTAAWAPLVPYAGQRVGADAGLLGLLLLCLGIGSLVTMPLSGALAARFGCRRVITVAGVAICAILPLLAVTASLPTLAASLLAFGAAVGAIDIAINVQAVIVERADGRALMSGFHGMFSVGGIAGSGGVGLLLWAGATPLAVTLAVGVVILLLLAVAGRHLLPTGGAGGAPSLALPRGIVLLIGALCFIAFLAEGAMLDWSAVFLTTLRSVPTAQAGVGYALFAAAMTAGRLGGDRLVQALGGRRVLLGGAGCAACGLTLAVAVPSAPAALGGFLLVGAGAANIVPVLYSGLGRQRVMAPNLAVAGVTTLGYAGILAGPALIGGIARWAGLSTAFLVVAAMLLVVAANCRVAGQPAAASRPAGAGGRHQ